MSPAITKLSLRQLRAPFVAVLLASIMTHASGCGIPKLRGALPGPCLPASYQVGTNWNRGQIAASNQESVPQATYQGSTNADRAPTNQAPSNSPGSNPPDQQDATKPNESTDSQAPADPSSPDSPAAKETSDKSTQKSDKSNRLSIKLVNFIKPSAAVKLDDEKKQSADEKSPQDAAVKDPANGSDPASPPAPAVDKRAEEVDGEALNTVLLSGGGWQIEPTGIPSSAVNHRFDMFNDAVLNGLIEQAIVGNQELKILAEDVRIACYEVQSRSGAYRPFVGYLARAGVEKSGRYTREGAVEDQLEGRPGRSFPDPLPDFMVGSTVSWEIDIWKRLRNAQRAAAMRYLSTQEGRNYVITRLVAEIASNYYELQALDNRLIALNQMIEIQQASLEIAKAKKAAARETELAVQRFQAEVRKNESERLIVQQQIVEAENRINNMMGRYPQPIPRPSVDFLNVQLSTLNTGLPPELLRNRADIRQAEREVRAAGLDVQVARARFYPALGISAGVGYRAFDARYLFQTPDSLIYNVAGDIVGPLVNKRAIQAEYRTANARQLQSVYNYQQTVIDAFTEVINYLAAIENYGKSIEIKKQQLESLEKSVDVASKLFQNARAEYMEVLLAQRDMMEARLDLIETKQQQLSAAVNAYRALGGGAY